MQPEPQPPVNPNEQPQPDFEPQTQQQPYAQPEPVATPEPVAPQPVAPPQPDQYTQPAAPFQSPEQPVTPQRPAEDPGKLFNILGLVGAFIGFQLPGLILSIIGRKKSKKAGYSTTLGTVGIILNAVFMVLTIGAIALFTLLAYQGVQGRAVDTSRQELAQSIMKKAEVYSAMNSFDTPVYPSIDDLRSSTEAPLSEEEKANLKDTEQPTGDEIGYIVCKDEQGVATGSNVFYYSSTDQLVVHAATLGECPISE